MLMSQTKPAAESASRIASTVAVNAKLRTMTRHCLGFDPSPPSCRAQMHSLSSSSSASAEAFFLFARFFFLDFGATPCNFRTASRAAASSAYTASTAPRVQPSSRIFANFMTSSGHGDVTDSTFPTERASSNAASTSTPSISPPIFNPPMTTVLGASLGPNAPPAALFFTRSRFTVSALRARSFFFSSSSSLASVPPLSVTTGASFFFANTIANFRPSISTFPDLSHAIRASSGNANFTYPNPRCVDEPFSRTTQLSLIGPNSFENNSSSFSSSQSYGKLRTNTMTFARADAPASPSSPSSTPPIARRAFTLFRAPQLTTQRRLATSSNARARW
mmetsp:Transcript_2608/g.9460  ORF Transcript_2608/g.9460 Transcript_2608/m.9460 type:complete len:334 (+) Transcript_2608:1823-2824(+)